MLTTGARDSFSPKWIELELNFRAVCPPRATCETSPRMVMQAVTHRTVRTLCMVLGVPRLESCRETVPFPSILLLQSLIQTLDYLSTLDDLWDLI